MSFEAAVHAQAIDLDRLSLEMCAASGSGHPTTAMSLGHLVTVLMFHTMRWSPEQPDYPTSDRLVLSEGHAVPVIYAAYARLGGMVGKDPESRRPLKVDDLKTLREIDSILDGHPNPMEGMPFFDAATGSLGQGLSVAAGLGAEVTVFDLQRERMDAARALGPNVTGLYPHPSDVADAVRHADIVVGAVYVTGKRAPQVVTADMVRSMEKGSVVVDIAIDQGGCIETSKATTYADPTYVWEGITHFTVTHMPGAVPRTASQALSAAIAPYASRLAAGGDWASSAALKSGINVQGGKVVHPALIG